MRSKKAVVMAIKSTPDIAQRSGLPAAADAVVLAGATPASCTRKALPCLMDHRIRLARAASPGPRRPCRDCKSSLNKAIFLKQAMEQRHARRRCGAPGEAA